MAFNPKPPTKNSENVKKLNQQENMEKYVDAPFKKVVFQPFQLFQPQIFTFLDSFLHWDPDQSSEAIGSGSMSGGAQKCGGQ